MAIRLMIEGQVQGVGYRYAFAEAARAHNLTGWVRNRLNGAVEACVKGELTDIEAIIAWAKRGPPSARVEHVSAEYADDSAAPGNSVDILPTQ